MLLIGAETHMSRVSRFVPFNPLGRSRSPERAAPLIIGP